LISCYRSTEVPTPRVNTITVYNNNVFNGNRRRAALVAPEPTLEVRQVTVVPTAIPAYASPCSGSVRYSSACSCVGVTATIVTEPVPTYSVVVATSTVVDTHPWINFHGYYGDDTCEYGDDGIGLLEAGLCQVLPSQFSIFDAPLQPGTCADTSDYVINFYGYSPHYDPGCDTVDFLRTVLPVPGVGIIAMARITTQRVIIRSVFE
jgi:hypothetical protein